MEVEEEVLKSESKSNNANDIYEEFDISSYISSYEGHTKLARLIFIAERSENLKELALKILDDELKLGCNSIFYTSFYKSQFDQSTSIISYNQEWVLSVEKHCQQKLNQLEAELVSAKSTLIKESIRLAYVDIGNLHYEMGNLNEALKSFIRTRDSNSLPRHTIEMCLKVIQISFDLKQYFNVTNFITKLAESGGDSVVNSKIAISEGLVALNDKLYHSAALRFVDIDPSLDNQFNGVLSSSDIGLYGAVLALATFDRTKLRKLVIDNKKFMNYLVLLPDIRFLVLNFAHGKYGDCLKSLDRLKSRLILDYYLASHASSLLSMIVKNILLLYLLPYSVVEINRMALALDWDNSIVIKSVEDLIADGSLLARIDCQSGIIYRIIPDPKSETIHKVLSLSNQLSAQIARDTLRLSLLQNGFMIDNKREVGDYTNPRKPGKYDRDNSFPKKTSFSNVMNRKPRSREVEDDVDDVEDVEDELPLGRDNSVMIIDGDEVGKGGVNGTNTMIVDKEIENIDKQLNRFLNNDFSNDETTLVV
eukprot:gene9702-13059_t